MDDNGFTEVETPNSNTQVGGVHNACPFITYYMHLIYCIATELCYLKRLIVWWL
ncbi:hypothetical protein ACW18Q_01755 [Limosilactobacillus reuteri]